MWIRTTLPATFNSPSCLTRQCETSSALGTLNFYDFRRRCSSSPQSTGSGLRLSAITAPSGRCGGSATSHVTGKASHRTSHPFKRRRGRFRSPHPRRVPRHLLRPIPPRCPMRPLADGRGEALSPAAYSRASARCARHRRSWGSRSAWWMVSVPQLRSWRRMCRNADGRGHRRIGSFLSRTRSWRREMSKTLCKVIVTNYLRTTRVLCSAVHDELGLPRRHLLHSAPGCLIVQRAAP